MNSRLLSAFAVFAALAGSAAPAVAAPTHADRDDDKVFDDLEAIVRKAPASRELRVIVSLSKDATRERVKDVAREVASVDPKKRFSLVDAFVATVNAGQVEDLAAREDVVLVERDVRVHALNASAQQSFGVTDAVADASTTLDGDGLTAAVIDTGIDATHDAFPAGKVVAFEDFTEIPEDVALDDAYDDNGHGTHVAATLAGNDPGNADGRGVAPEADLVGLKVLDATGSGFTSDVVEAIEWATDNRVAYGIEVINMSLGAEGCSDGTGSEADAIDAAVAVGITVVVAAGNEGPGRCSVGSPAAVDSALTVGAMADTGVGGFFMADFSSRGETLDGRVKPDIAAPGVRITSADADIDAAGPDTGDTYVSFNGTSMATPFVAGLVLLMLDANAALDPDDVKAHIKNTAIDWGRGGDATDPAVSGTDVDYGAGRLDAYEALDAAGAAGLVSPPAVPSHELVNGALAGTGEVAVFELTATDSTFPLAVTLTLEEEASVADFDMYLYDEAGQEVAVFDRRGDSGVGAKTGLRQDAFWLPAAAPQQYTLVVSSWNGTSDFFLDVSGGDVSAVPAPPSGGVPSVTGEPRDGRSLTASPGTWSGSQPMTFAFQWQRCSADLATCSSVSGEVGETYSLTAADVGARLRVVVTASNSVGTASATSAATEVVGAEPPQSLTAPVVTGTAEEGAVLAGTNGSWSGTAPIAFQRQWFRCTSDGASCTAISGATAATYEVGSADAGSRLFIHVKATNAGGVASRDSGLTGVVPTRPPPDPPAAQPPQPQPPQPTAAPAISGRVRHKSVLSTSDGSWLGAAPLVFSYRWLRCDENGTSCAVIGTATEAAYSVKAADVGHRLRSRILTANSDGNASADSALTAVVRALRPSPRRRPSTDGDARTGGLLTAHRGRWRGTRPLEFGFQWLRCDDGCQKIEGATGGAYLPRKADLGSRIRLRVTATNEAGSRKARSGRTAKVRDVFGKRKRRALRRAKRAS